MNYQKMKDWIMSDEFKELYKKFNPELRKFIRHQFSRLPSGGGGNHFSEIQKDKEGNIWVMLHFGSRNLGQQFGKYYNKLAKDLNNKWFSSVPKEYDLAFLPIDTKEAQEYLSALEICKQYAKYNHLIAMDKIKEIFKQRTNCSFLEYYYVPHNYASWENHYGKDVIVHRKGATLAREDTIGIIPGSQGTASYIVIGKGNKDSFNSCSHGAGRKMGRKEAQRTLSLEEEKKKLDERGIVHSIRYEKDLDEASGAYKDIDIVMKEQEDLVDIKVKLVPLGVIKG